MGKGVLLGEPTYQKDATSWNVGIVYYRSTSRVRTRRTGEKKLTKEKASTPVHISRWHSMRSRARKKGLECTMTTGDVLRVMELPCIYCGSHAKYSELDRKDSAIGYLVSNVVPACRRCNTIKNNVVTYEEMLKIVDILGWRVI